MVVEWNGSKKQKAKSGSGGEEKGGKEEEKDSPVEQTLREGYRPNDF